MVIFLLLLHVSYVLLILEEETLICHEKQQTAFLNPNTVGLYSARQCPNNFLCIDSSRCTICYYFCRWEKLRHRDVPVKFTLEKKKEIHAEHFIISSIYHLGSI